MVRRRSLYNEIKAAQAACLFLKLNGGSMDYLKTIKLLYSVEKEALNRWMRPVIYDDLYSMPHGQAVSQTLDRAEYRERPPISFWNEHIKNDGNNNLHVIKECGISKLSRAEIELIKEIFDLNKDKTPEQLIREHHDPVKFPEWKNPHGSRIKTSYDELLKKLGKSAVDIEEFKSDIDELRYLEEMKC